MNWEGSWAYLSSRSIPGLCLALSILTESPFWSGVLPASLEPLGGRDTGLKLTDWFMSYLCGLPVPDRASRSHVSPGRVSPRYGVDGSLACCLVSPAL